MLAKLDAHEKEEIERELVCALREHAANMLRIVRGAGRPHDIIKGAIGIADAMTRYRDALGQMPDAHLIHTALTVRREPRDASSSEFDQMISGALRAAAARLLRQDLQEAHGENEMKDAIYWHTRRRAAS